jgi:hypothetical protein
MEQIATALLATASFLDTAAGYVKQFGEVAPIWVVITLAMGFVASFAIWSRRPTWLRGLTVGAFLLSAPITAVALALSLGWPVPLINGLIAPAGDWSVLGSKMVVQKGIYVLLDTGETPRHYVLPWDREMADKIQELQEEENGGVMMKVPPFEFSWEKRKPPEFYALPQMKVLPDKPQQQAPKRFESI